MGLEIVELFMRLEEEFGIEIGDGEAEQCETAGKLCHLVQVKLNISPADRCLSSAAFYQTRRALMEITGKARQNIRPKTPIEQVFGEITRRQNWEQFQSQTGIELPDLELPHRFFSAICGGFALCWLAAMISFLIGATFWGWASLCGGIVYLWLASQLTLPWKKYIPASYQTVGDLSKIVMVSHLQSSPETAKNAKAEEIWEVVRSIIADELGVPLEQVTRDAHFVRDLGAG